MNFFEALVSSIQDPQAGTQKSDLENLLGALTGGSSPVAGALPPGAAEELAGTVGSMLKPALREAGQQGGAEGIDALLGSLKENSSSPQQIERTLGRERVEQMVNQAGRKSGATPDVIMSMLPVIIPALVSLLQSGARSGATSSAAQAGAVAGDPTAGLLNSNPLLKGFLDSDGDGDVDMADLVAMSSKFLR
ncbi:MAG: hypothetical protein WCI38_10280 [Chthoniobacterales bacterium]|jgi:uncharacterized protein YidB (DUF937 family)